MAALVEYSDSDSDENSNSSDLLSHQNPVVHESAEKRSPASALPPLPTKFQDLYLVSARASVLDDPELHAGRQRAIPHIEGNWPTHVYLEWYPSDTESSLLSSLIAHYQHQQNGQFKVHSLLYSELDVPLPLHISLSRPIVLKTEERAAFSRILEDKIVESAIGSFHCRIEDLDWESNFDGTRCFLVLRVSCSPKDSLNRLLGISNGSVSTFNQPPLYQKPDYFDNGKEGKAENTPDVTDYSNCFHISIAWSLVEPPVKSMPLSAIKTFTRLRKIHIPFSSVKVKVGNQILDIPFPLQHRT